MINRIGRYQVVRSLAKAGADEIFLGQTLDAQGAEYHAVRRIHDGAFEIARRAVRLRHANLVSVRELGADDGRWFIATEYVHGETLRRLLARVRRTDDQVPIAIVTAIGLGIAAGLHHVHTHHGPRRAWRGIVHGCVSPSGIVIGYDGSVKLGDVGIGVPADASYLAPEQVAGELVDKRSDVFALGAVLYELVTARRLFRAPSDALTRAAITHGNIPPPSRFRRGLPRALESIILTALAPSPTARFRSAGELRAALETFARGLGMAQSPATIADYLKKVCGTRPFPWLASVRTRAARAGRTTEVNHHLDDDGQLGVAAPPESVLRELGVPEARALEATPGRGTKTPMSWMTQAPPPPPPLSRRRLGVMGAAAVVAGFIGFFLVSSVMGGGGNEGGNGIAPAAAPLPPPPPEIVVVPIENAPAPPPVTPDAGVSAPAPQAPQATPPR